MQRLPEGGGRREYWGEERTLSDSETSSEMKAEGGTVGGEGEIHLSSPLESGLPFIADAAPGFGRVDNALGEVAEADIPDTLRSRTIFFLIFETSLSTRFRVSEAGIARRVASIVLMSSIT